MRTLTATVAQNATARDFVSLLPLTLGLSTPVRTRNPTRVSLCDGRLGATRDVPASRRGSPCGRSATSQRQPSPGRSSWMPTTITPRGQRGPAGAIRGSGQHDRQGDGGRLIQQLGFAAVDTGGLASGGGPGGRAPQSMARTSAGRKDGRRWLSGRCLFVRNVFAPRAAADVDRAGHESQRARGVPAHGRGHRRQQHRHQAPGTVMLVLIGVYLGALRPGRRKAT